MMIVQDGTPAAHLPPRWGATLALPLLDAMVPALTAPARPPPRRCRASASSTPEWRHPGSVDAGVGRTQLRALADPARRSRHSAIRSWSCPAWLTGRPSRSATAMPTITAATAAWLSGVHAWTANDGPRDPARHDRRSDCRERPRKDTGCRRSSSRSKARPRLPATAAPTASTRTRSRGARRPSRCRPRFIRGSSSNGCSATAATPTSAWPRCGGAPAFSIRLIDEVERLNRRLGTRDRSSSTSISSRSDRLSSAFSTPTAQSAEASLELPERPTDIPATLEEHAKLMFDLQALAFQADITRVFTLLVGREQTNRTYPEIGVPDGHHAVSHHQHDPALVAKKAKIDTYHVALLAHFLEKLRTTPDGDGRCWTIRCCSTAAASATAICTRTTTCRCWSPEAVRVS